MAKFKKIARAKKDRKAFTITTPKVRAFLDYLTTDAAFENPNKFNAYTYSKQIQTLTPQALYKYLQIEGFDEEVTRRKEAYTAKEKLRIVKLARAGLETLAAGKAQRESITVNSFGRSVTVETLEPQRAACVDLLKINGDYEETVTVKSKFELAIKTAAAKIDEVDK